MMMMIIIIINTVALDYIFYIYVLYTRVILNYKIVNLQ